MDYGVALGVAAKRKMSLLPGIESRLSIPWPVTLTELSSLLQQNATGRRPQPEVSPLWVSALVRTVVSEIIERDDMGNQLEGCSESTWWALIRVHSLVCHPLVRQNRNPHNNIETDATHSAYTSTVLFGFYVSSVPSPVLMLRILGLH